MSQQREAVVEITGMQKWFHDRPVLKNINLTLHKGEVMTLVGPSGSGKSTLLRCLNQLEEIDAGDVRFRGDRLSITEHEGRLFRLPESTIVRQRRPFGMVFQHFNLFPHKTALDNIIEAPIHVGRVSRSAATKRAMELLDRVGLASHADHYPAELSGGQQQRVAIARALAMDPEVMLFDEPTSALDPELVGEVIRVIKDLAASGMTMMVVTHEMSLGREISDTVVFMEDGWIVEKGPPEHMFSTNASERTHQFVSRLDYA